MGEETLVLGVLSDEAPQSTADHGVLAHENDSLTTEGLTDLVHLLGGDTGGALDAGAMACGKGRDALVDADNENGLVLLEEALELIEVSGLVLRLAPHSFGEV